MFQIPFSLRVPYSLYGRFRHEDKNLRWGQAFHQFIQAHKCVQNKQLLDYLYNEKDDQRAKSWVLANLIDFQN